MTPDPASVAAAPVPARARRCLLIAAALAAVVALLHLGIIFAPADAYAYFGAPDLAGAKAGGSRVPDAMSAALSGLFGLWAYYAWAGAARGRAPRLQAGRWAIGAIFALRGLAVIWEAIALWQHRPAGPVRHTFFSAFSLVTGLCYLAGAWLRRAPD